MADGGLFPVLPIQIQIIFTGQRRNIPSVSSVVGRHRAALTEPTEKGEGQLA
jgi:hypothetical protein